MADSQQFDGDIRAALEATYALERELMGGGMSRVFLATERSLNRRVVIKVLPPELAAGVNRDRFRQEIQMAAQLQHPHIVPLYAAGEYGDLLYYTMPFIEGESLRHALHGDAPVRFAVRDVVRILHDVVDALAYAHARGVIHRDIKPGNVLRSGTHAVVTDFGVAKAISVSRPLSGVTMTGMAVGTPAYMAPEQLAGDPAADHRMDIYAVGLLAYELLTGVAPFSSPSPQQTLTAQLTRDPPPIDKVRSDVPPGLSALIMRCLAKLPDNRPPDAASLLRELEAVAPDSGDFPARRRGSRQYLAVGALALIAAAAVFVSTRDAAPGKADSPPAKTASVTTVPRPATVTPAPPPIPLLTRAESLAIAAAVARKMQQTTIAAPLAAQGLTREQIAQVADSLRAAIQSAVIDSFMKLQRGVPPAPGGDRFGARGAAADAHTATSAFDELNRMGRGFSPRDPSLSREAFGERASNPGPPRRVFVSIPAPTRRDPDVDAAAVSVMDSLRRRLAQSRRFIVVDRDSVQLALSRSRVTDSLATLLRVDVFASLYPQVGRDSTVRWTLRLHDLSANPSFGNRSVVVKVPRDSLLASIDSLLRGATRSLDEMDRAPRRRPGEPQGGHPTLPTPVPPVPMSPSAGR